MRTEAYLRLVWAAEQDETTQSPHAEAARNAQGLEARGQEPHPRHRIPSEGGGPEPHQNRQAKLWTPAFADDAAEKPAAAPTLRTLYTPPMLPAFATPRRRSGPSLKSLAALALVVAGLIIAAQAAFMPAKAQAAQFLMQRAWDARLSTGEPARPWPWADFAPEARLSFPDQNQHVLALTDAAGESLAFGPTRLAASVHPGEPGVAVYAAHRDTHFRFLDRLLPGDPVVIDTPDRQLTFRVIGSSVVRWDDSDIRPRDAGRSRIALVTCWPLDAKFQGPMRYVVWAELDEAA